MSTNIGGQAVIEGVMMRDREEMSIAVRKPDQSICLVRKDISSLARRFPFLRLPLFRGVLAFFESLVLGVKALNFSADQALEEEEEQLQPWHLGLTMGIALVLSIGLFILLPTFLVRYLLDVDLFSPLAKNLLEGILRLTIFLGYVGLISRMPDIQRVFQYHGAEHKVIQCYEEGLPLNVQNSRDFTTLHPRCGTSFLLLVMVISILFFSLFGWPNLLARILIRLSLLPLVAGLSYEAVRFMGRSKSPLVRVIALPGLALQKLTTREPDDSQLEVALKALEPLVEREAGQEKAGERPEEAQGHSREGEAVALGGAGRAGETVALGDTGGMGGKKQVQGIKEALENTETKETKETTGTTETTETTGTTETTETTGTMENTESFRGDASCLIN